MRKTVVLFLTLLYTLSTSGVTISNFYCCGKLKETSLFSDLEGKRGCEKDGITDDCCKTKIHFVKVSDQHSLASRIKVNHEDQVTLLPFLPASTIYVHNIAVPCSSVLTKAPPLARKQPVYLDHCTFRI